MNFSVRLIAAAVSLTVLPTALLTAALPVLAQAIPVTTPRLPPRSAGPGAAAPAPAPAPTQAATQAQPQANMQAGRPATGSTGMQAGMQQGAQQGRYQGNPTQASTYANPAPQGQPYGAYAAAPAAAPVMPQRAEAGTCRAQLSPDRQALMLVSGAPALARAHLPLGEFRAQQVVHSPDGRWAVAYTKLRGAAQYAALTIDLERCELQRVVDLNAAGEDVRFDGDDAVLRLANGERRIALRDGRVR